MARPAPSTIQGYNISVLGKQIEITDAIRNYVFEKLEKLERISPTSHLIDVVVTLDKQKLDHSCSILVNFYFFHIKVTKHKDNLYEAIDVAIDRVLKLIRRYKTKLQSTRAKDVSTVDIHVNVIKPLRDELSAVNDEILAENVREEAERWKDPYHQHTVLAQEKIALKTLRQDEAIMKMELSEEPFLIFRGEEDQKLKVIYRREDQNYGIIQVE
jgi:putative sigma-54 modulation protein